MNGLSFSDCQTAPEHSAKPIVAEKRNRLIETPRDGNKVQAVQEGEPFFQINHLHLQNLRQPVDPDRPFQYGQILQKLRMHRVDPLQASPDVFDHRAGNSRFPLPWLPLPMP